MPGKPYLPKLGYGNNKLSAPEEEEFDEEGKLLRKEEKGKIDLNRNY